MSSYSGITSDAVLLLSENRFRDSREFYEEHKEQIKQTATVPMRQIASELGSLLSPLDPMMVTDPVKMVSRIRRDTRFSKDLHLYRDNIWIMFMRNKHRWPHHPCMWFEFRPGSYTLGIGLFYQTPGLMEFWRRAIRENPDEFRSAVQSVEKSGAVFDGEHYKKPKDGCPEGLEQYYNAKSVWFAYTSPDMKDLEDDTIIEKLKAFYTAFSDMYLFMLGAADSYVASMGGHSYFDRNKE